MPIFRVASQLPTDPKIYSSPKDILSKSKVWNVAVELIPIELTSLVRLSAVIAVIPDRMVTKLASLASSSYLYLKFVDDRRCIIIFQVHRTRSKAELERVVRFSIVIRAVQKYCN